MIERNDPPACGDCLHFWNDNYHCSREEVKTFDIIRGRVSQWVSIARSPDGACGPDGKYFTPIPPPTKGQIAWRVGLVGATIAILFIWIGVR